MWQGQPEGVRRRPTRTRSRPTIEEAMLWAVGGLIGVGGLLILWVGLATGLRFVSVVGALAVLFGIVIAFASRIRLNRRL
jgi:hypothetical protein